jgi:Na+-transporting NADH:ubiquinone oxidoreductase subunit NqrC
MGRPVQHHRDRFLNEISDIPIANKAYRLRVLQRMSTDAEKMKNMGMTAQLLEQAAKEVGDVYTNKQKVEQSVVATHNVMPVPSCDNVEDWEKAAQKQQGEVLGG